MRFLNRQNAKHATRAAKGHVRTSCAIILCTFLLAQARSDCCVLAVQKTFFLLKDRHSGFSYVVWKN
jgi:hypothetical protein